jgi:hypothetical protein
MRWSREDVTRARREASSFAVVMQEYYKGTWNPDG